MHNLQEATERDRETVAKNTLRPSVICKSKKQKTLKTEILNYEAQFARLDPTGVPLR